jgi:hydrogenase maturation protease
MLVIAIGNPLRQDDGVAWAVAAALENEPGVEVRTVHQLLPELVGPMSRASAVVFVDAREGGAPGSVRRVPVLARDDAFTFPHSLDPGRLLSLCRRIHGRMPPAVAVTVSGERFGFGQELSSEVRRAVPQAALSALRPLV